MEEKQSSNVKSILAGIFLSILAFVLFYVVLALIAGLLSGLFSIISNIPVLNILTDFLFKIRGDSPSILIQIIACSIAYWIISEISKRVIKSENTQRKTYVFLGILLVIFNIIVLIVNLINGDSILPDIITGVAGGFFIFKSPHSK